MTTSYVSKSSVSYYSNINGKENFKKMEIDDDNGNKSMKTTTLKGNKLITKIKNISNTKKLGKR